MPEAFVPIGVDPPSLLSDAQRDSALARSDLSAAWLVHELRGAGIEIDRMSSPALIEQLLHSASRPIDTVVCAVLDPDATVRLNAAVATAFPEDVRFGVRCVAKAVNAQRSIIVADSTVRAPKLAGRRNADNPRLTLLEQVYPQLHPSLLLKAVLKRRLAAGRLPVEAGVIQLDAAAAWVIGRLIAGGVSHAIPIAIRDQRVGKSFFAAAAPELKLSDILAALQIREPGETDAAIAGELLLRRPAELAATAGKSSGVFHLIACTGPRESEPCVRCNWCADICPTGVLPMVALEAAQFSDRALADRATANACIECGLCDYVCPSRLPLVAATRAARRLIIMPQG